MICCNYESQKSKKETNALLGVSIPLVSFFLLVLVGCTPEKKIEKRWIDDYYVEAIFTNDGLINGNAKFYYSPRRLAYTGYFIMGNKHGGFNYFDLDGRRTDSLNFTADIMHGRQYSFFKNGEVSRVKSYFHGLPVGEEIYFRDGKVEKYFFTDFHKNELVTSSFDSLGSLDSISFFTTNPSFSRVNVNDKAQVSILFYTPIIPTTQMSLNVGLSRRNHPDSTLFNIDQSSPVFDTILPYPDSNSAYYISTHIKAGKFNRVYIEELRFRQNFDRK